MKAYNIPLYIRLSIASFLGWSVLRVIYRYWQFHGTLPFGITLPGPISIAGFLIGLFAGSSLFLGVFFAFSQWIVLRPYIKSVWTWILLQVLVWVAAGLINMVLIFLFVKILYNNDALAIYLRATIDALMISISIGLIQNSTLRKTTGVFPWWVVFPAIGIFIGILVERLNQNFVFMDPLHATLLASGIIAVVASLPSLWIMQDVHLDQSAELSTVK